MTAIGICCAKMCCRLPSTTPASRGAKPSATSVEWDLSCGLIFGLAGAEVRPAPVSRPLVALLCDAPPQLASLCTRKAMSRQLCVTKSIDRSSGY